MQGALGTAAPAFVTLTVGDRLIDLAARQHEVAAAFRHLKRDLRNVDDALTPAAIENVIDQVRMVRSVDLDAARRWTYVQVRSVVRLLFLTVLVFELLATGGRACHFLLQRDVLAHLGWLLKINDDNIRTRAASTLQVIAGYHAHYRNRVNESPALESLLEVILSHSLPAPVRCAALQAVVNCMRHRPEPDIRVVKRVIFAAVRCLYDADRAVVALACWVLQFSTNAARHVDALLRQIRVVPNLVDLVTMQLDEVTVPLLGLIINVVQYSKDSLQALADIRALPTLFNLVSHADPMIGKEVCRLIANVCRARLVHHVPLQVMERVAEGLWSQEAALITEAAYALANYIKVGPPGLVTSLFDRRLRSRLLELKSMPEALKMPDDLVSQIFSDARKKRRPWERPVVEPARGTRPREEDPDVAPAPKRSRGSGGVRGDADMLLD